MFHKQLFYCVKCVTMLNISSSIFPQVHVGSQSKIKDEIPKYALREFSLHMKYLIPFSPGVAGGTIWMLAMTSVGF